MWPFLCDPSYAVPENDRHDLLGRLDGFERLVKEWHVFIAAILVCSPNHSN